MLFEGSFQFSFKLLVLRRKTSCFCFLPVLLPMKFHFSPLKRFCFLSAHPEYLKYCFETALLRCSVMDRRVLGAPCPHQARPSKALMRTKRGLGLLMFSSAVGFSLGNMGSACGLLVPTVGQGQHRQEDLSLGCCLDVALLWPLSPAGTTSTRPAGMLCPCFPALDPSIAPSCGAALQSCVCICRRLSCSCSAACKGPWLKDGE